MELHMKMPDLATTGSDIRLLRWLAQPGQIIQRGQPLLEIETDKAVSQVESIATGVLKEVRARPDSQVAVGKVIAVIEMIAVPTGSHAEAIGAVPASGQPPETG